MVIHDYANVYEKGGEPRRQLNLKSKQTNKLTNMGLNSTYYINTMIDDKSIESKIRLILDTDDLSITQTDQRLAKQSDILLHEKMFKKLKFLYLEQETRHLFLKQVLDSDNQLLTEDQTIFDMEYNSLQQDASQGKEELKRIKEELKKKINELTTHTDETYLLLKNFENRSKNVKDLFSEFDDLENRIDDVLQ